MKYEITLTKLRRKAEATQNVTRRKLRQTKGIKIQQNFEIYVPFESCKTKAFEILKFRIKTFE